VIVKNAISQIIMPLTKDDTGEQALSIMHAYHVRELALVDGKKFVALLSEEFILNNKLDEKIEKFNLPLFSLTVFENDHVFDAIHKLSINKLTLMPVVDPSGDYLGSIIAEDLLHFIGNSYSFNEPGSIIVLETNRSNFSLGEIARIAESENVSILASFISAEKESTELLITLKLNTFEITRVISAYQRYDYVISKIFSSEDYVDVLKERYDSLMHYINL
jgi:acetoin utilization protein AcuB